MVNLLDVPAQPACLHAQGDDLLQSGWLMGARGGKRYVLHRKGVLRGEVRDDVLPWRGQGRDRLAREVLDLAPGPVRDVLDPAGRLAELAQALAQALPHLGQALGAEDD